MRHEGDITEADVLTAIEGIYLVNSEEGRESLFTINDIAWIISDVHEPWYPAQEDIINSIRYHILRLRRKGYVVKHSNTVPKGMGRPQALYKRTEEGVRATLAYEEADR